MTNSADYTFTICFCTRSRPLDLARALLSLPSTTYPIHQVIVSDDSPDSDRATQQLIAESFPTVAYAEGPRRGLSANRNIALTHATGTHVVFMDDDTTLGETFLDTIVAAYNSIDHDLRDTTVISGLEDQNGRLIEPSNLSFWGFVDQPRTAATTRPLHTAVINATAFPRTIFSKIAFDENLVYGSDEVDICTQAVAAGYRFQLCREAINKHFPSPLHRSDYSRFTTASRIYTTFKRHLYLEKSPHNAALYAVLGPLKLAQSELRAKGPKGVIQLFGSIRLAAGYTARYVRSGLAHR